MNERAFRNHLKRLTFLGITMIIIAAAGLVATQVIPSSGASDGEGATTLFSSFSFSTDGQNSIYAMSTILLLIGLLCLGSVWQQWGLLRSRWRR